MRVIRRLLKATVRRARAQDGIALLYVLIAMVVVFGVSGAALAAVTISSQGTTTDTGQKQAYAAAQAGIQRYLFDLNTNNTYWTQCVPATANWIVNTGASEVGHHTPVPGPTPGSYTVMLLPASQQSTYTQCNVANPISSMITATGTDAGTLRIASTGYSGTAQRTIVAAIRQQNFLDYAYFTVYETSDPLVQVDDAFAATNDADTAIEPPDQCQANGNPTGCGNLYTQALTGGSSNDGHTYPGATKQCTQYRYQTREGQAFWNNTYTSGGRSTSLSSAGAGSCTDIQFIANDQINGPFHSNDSVLICGSPTFGQLSTDSVEFGGDASVYPSGSLEASGCSGAPNVTGKLTKQDAHLNMPPIGALASVAGTSYSGTTCLVLNATNIQVAQPTAGQSCATSSLTYSTISYPSSSNGVLYVNNSTSAQCNYTYDVDDPVYTVSTSNVGCGTVFVKGVAGYPLTIGAAQDVVIDGNLTYPTSNTNGAMLGLIANGFVRVYHPVFGGVCTSGYNSSYSTNPSGFTPITQINAAILSLTHSFIVDNYACGPNLGTLNVTGSIAQNFRGTVGAGNAGYTKNYVYDRRLEYEEPPHFLAPSNGAYAIAHQTECDVAATCNSTS